MLLDKLNPAEAALLASLKTSPNAQADLEGVRGKVLIAILGEVGIPVTAAWHRMADSLDHAVESGAVGGPDFEGRILERQGRQFGENDAY